MSLEPFIENLADSSAQVPSADFVELSDLSPSELGVFARTWFTIPEDRQLWIVSTMAELAEDSAELDFHAIFKMCLKDGGEAVVEKAMEGLWELEDRSIIPYLIAILLSDRGPSVRAAAAVALGKFPLLVQEGKLLPKDGDSIHDSLMAVLEDSDQPPEVRRRSLESIAPFNTSAIQSYLSRAYNSGDLGLKSSSIFAMGRTGETSWLPLLIKEIQSSEPSIRYESAHACGELGEEDAVPHLITLLDDEDFEVQMAGISALGQIGGPLAKKILQHCVQEGDATLEEAARAELQNIEFTEDPMAFNSES